MTIAFLFSLAWLAVPASAGDYPPWIEGTTWVVKTIYRDSRQGDEDPEHGGSSSAWSSPIYWTYRVKRVKPIQGGKSYLIQVVDKTASRANGASLIVDHFDAAQDGQEVMALTSIKLYEPVAGEITTQSHVFTSPGEDPAPVTGDESIIPFDFPVMPLIEGSSDGPETKRVKLYTISEGAETLTFARDIEQTEYVNKPLGSFVDGELKTYFDGKGFPVEGLKMVELHRNFDGTRIKQIWTSGYPWYLYSERPDRRSWLWEVQGLSGSQTPQLAPPSVENGSAAPPEAIPTPAPKHGG